MNFVDFHIPSVVVWYSFCRYTEAESIRLDFTPLLIWKNRPHYLKKTVLCNSIEDGGLNVIDFNTANCVFKNKWIKNYLKFKGKICNIIPEFIFDKLGGDKFFWGVTLILTKFR